MPSSRPPQRNRLSSAQARRALYIDFEGRKNALPVLLGCARKASDEPAPRTWHIIVSALFAPLAKSDGLDLMSLPAAVEQVVLRAESKDRRIVAWSEHELDVVSAHCSAALTARFEACFVNARALADHWANACYPGRRPAESKLSDFLAFIGYPAPDEARPGRVGETLGILEAALARELAKGPGKGRGIEGLTENQRQRWRQLRVHNAHDCAGMRQVCLRAARELEARAAAAAAASARTSAKKSNRTSSRASTGSATPVRKTASTTGRPTK
jgi:hypothetical protein